VAVYTLRRTLRNIWDTPLILLHESAYQIKSGFAVWVDVEAFEQHMQDALQMESSGAN